MTKEKRSASLAFACPNCRHKNLNPRVDKTEGGTDIAICDECGQQVSAHLIADLRSQSDRAREAAIRKWTGWDDAGSGAKL